jgi:hypothetical protein
MERRIKREFKNKKYIIEQVSPMFKKLQFKYNNIDIVAIIPSDYPFKPIYELYLDDVKMTHQYFHLQPSAVLNEIKKRKTVNCQICNSFLCSDNWSPGGITIIDVVKQFIPFVEQVKTAEKVVYFRNNNTTPLCQPLVEKVLNYI